MIRPIHSEREKEGNDRQCSFHWLDVHDGKLKKLIIHYLVNERKAKEVHFNFYHYAPSKRNYVDNDIFVHEEIS